MGIPSFSGCTAGSYCSDQQATKVGDKQTQIYHRTVTTLTGQGPAYTGSKTETYIIKPNAAGVDTWTLAATSTDGGRTQTFTDAAGADVRKSMAPGGNLNKNIQAQVQKTVSSGGAKQGLVALPGTSGSLEKLTPEQQKAVGVISPSTSDDKGSQLAERDAKTQKAGTRDSFRKDLVYPVTLKLEHQDVVKFNMLKFRPRALQTGGDLNPVGDRPSGDIIGTVVLPIPAGISDQNSCNWGQDELDPFKALGVDIAKTSIVQGIGAGMKTLGDAATAVADNSGDAGSAVANKFVEAATGTQNILSRTQGRVVNPNMELLFVGPSLRSFAFTFKFSARGKEESVRIRDIIRFFKQGMAPIRTDAQLFLKAPHTFQIQYLHKKNPHKFLNKFKECALKDCSVQYTPVGEYATFHDGAMVSYSMTLQFQELEPVFNDEYTQEDGDIGF